MPCNLQTSGEFSYWYSFPISVFAVRLFEIRTQTGPRLNSRKVRFSSVRLGYAQPNKNEMPRVVGPEMRSD